MNNFKTVRFLLAISILNTILFLLMTKMGDITAFLVTMLVAHCMLSVETEKDNENNKGVN